MSRKKNGLEKALERIENKKALLKELKDELKKNPSCTNKEERKNLKLYRNKIRKQIRLGRAFIGIKKSI